MDTISNQRRVQGIFIWRIAALHTIAYFIAGLFSVLLMNYSEEFGSETMANIMLPVDHWQVAIGLGVQPIRGMIIGLVLLPFRSIILADKGWIKLAVLILGLSYLSTIGPTVGSFDGYIFTKVELKYHLLGIPETLIYILLFTSLISFWYKYPWRGVNFMFSIFVGFIILMSLLGFFDRLGLINGR